MNLRLDAFNKEQAGLYEALFVVSNLPVEYEGNQWPQIRSYAFTDKERDDLYDQIKASLGNAVGIVSADTSWINMKADPEKRTIPVVPITYPDGRLEVHYFGDFRKIMASPYVGSKGTLAFGPKTEDLSDLEMQWTPEKVVVVPIPKPTPPPAPPGFHWAKDMNGNDILVGNGPSSALGLSEAQIGQILGCISTVLRS